MDRASDSGSECWGFESLRAYHAHRSPALQGTCFFTLAGGPFANQASRKRSLSWEGTPPLANVPPARLPAASASGVPHKQVSCIAGDLFFCFGRWSFRQSGFAQALAFLGRDPSAGKRALSFCRVPLIDAKMRLTPISEPHFCYCVSFVLKTAGITGFLPLPRLAPARIYRLSYLLK